MQCNVILKSFHHLVESCSENLEISALGVILWNTVDSSYLKKSTYLKTGLNSVFFVTGPFFRHKSYNSFLNESLP